MPDIPAPPPASRRGPADPARLTPAGAVRLVARTDTGARFDTDQGPLTVESYAPGILRLRLGGPAGPDYGILEAAPAPDVPVSVTETETGWTLAGGALSLAIERDVLAIALSRTGAERTPLLASSHDGHFRRRFRLPPFARTDKGWFCAVGLASDEPVYGLGEKWGRLDRRGQLVVSRNEDALGVNAEKSYKNTPFAWSPEGWGLFVHTPATVTHGVGFGPWSHRAYGLEVEDAELDLFVIAADGPAAILERYTWLTGRPRPVPRWSLGVWMSRAYYRSPEEALAIAEELRARDIPCDVLTLDGRAWLDVDTRFAFKWDETRWADRAAFIASVKRRGFRLCVWEYPYISVNSPHFAEWGEEGWLLTRDDGTPYAFDWDPEPFGELLTPLPSSGILDFTNPEAEAFWREQHHALFDGGVDVIKTDFGEQVPDDARAHNGDTGARLHNVYPLLYNASVHRATEAWHDGPALVFGRSGWAGSQRYPMQWGGDPQTDWEGLAASIRGGLGWQLSGAACYATDIGGFYGPEPEPELYIRWAQAGIFASHVRFHGTGPREPWHFGPEAEAVVRDFLTLRMRLIPYLEGCLAEAEATGMPVQRAMALAFPHDPAARAFDTQFLFGPAILVAPVLRPGGQVTVYLPEGRWHDWFTGDVVEGGQSLRLTVPLDRLPVYVAEGWAIPLGPAVPSTAEIDETRRVDELRRFGATRCVAPVPGIDLGG
jgi:alpha-D-xyloside xylohydrolase